MKKGIVLIFVILSFLINLTVSGAQNLTITCDGMVYEYTGNIFTLKVNGEIIDTDLPPIIIDGRSLVPVRAIFEKLGAKVLWDDPNKTATVSYNGIDIVLKINDKYALVNGEKIEMEVPAKIMNDRTVVPLRFVGENLNMKVGWHEEAGEITIDNNMGSINDIKYSGTDDLHEIKIELDSQKNYKITRVSNPERIVIDFANTEVADVPNNINIDSNILKSIRSGQLDAITARVVMDVEEKPQYRVREDKNCVLLYLEPKKADDNSDDFDKEGEEDLKTDGNNSENILDIKHISASDHEEVHIRSNKIADYESFLLTDQINKIVVDVADAHIKNALQQIDVDSRLIAAIRCANQKNDTARVVVDLKSDSNYKIIKSGDYIVVYVSSGPIANNPELSLPTRGDGGQEQNQNDKILYVAYEPYKDWEEVSLSIGNYENYNISKNMGNSSIVIEIPGALAPLQEKEINANSNFIKSIKYVSTEASLARVTINLKGQSTYRILEDKGKIRLLFFEEVGGVDPWHTPEPTGSVTPTPAPPIPETTPTNEEDNGLDVDYIISEQYNKVFLNIKGYGDYKASRLSEPERIIIDITGSKVDKDQKVIEIKSGLIGTIRYAQFKDDVTRVVIDTKGQLQYNIEQIDSGLVIYMMKSTYKNIEYSNSMDRVHFILKGAKLTEGGENLKKLYKDNYDMDGRRYTITFPSNLADIGTGLMEVNDGIVDYVNIYKNTATNETSMEFNTFDSYDYLVIARSDTNDTAITLLKRYTKGERLIVIDAGHGGVEPGAVHGGYHEKDLNLDIAKRVNKLLKSKNINTYMIREDDSFVGLYERAYIANTLNATLFLSIHNNAYYERFKGTETLYYPPSSSSTGFNGERFALITQRNLINKLNTHDRGIVKRPNLVVLKATKMPAVLAEIAFMTNAEDMANLRAESFRQRAAEALCDAIIQALEELE